MFESFKPTWMVESIHQITAQQLKAENIQGVIADLDNTLVAWNHPDGTEETLQWIEEMKDAGIEVLILSNNIHYRVEKVAKLLDVAFVPNALKPLGLGFEKAFKKMDTPKEQTIMIGDQIITDIKGANRAGIRSALVKPLITSDAWNTRFNRFIELKIMTYLIKKDPQMKWRDSLHVKSN